MAYATKHLTGLNPIWQIDKCVSWNGTQSDNIGISIGVPQGSILVPLFFTLYVNDYPDCLHYSSAHMYADDTTQDVSDKYIDVIVYK